jgi:hypothetical protein
MGESGAEHPNVAGPGDVDDTGGEEGQLGTKPTVVPRDEKVETETEIKRDTERTFAELDEGDGAFVESAGRLTGPYHEQRYLVTLRVGDELPADGGDAIDFVVGIGA